MAMERSIVVGVFTDRSDAEDAINDLHGLGFTDQQVGFITRGEGAVNEAREADDHDNHNKAGEAAGTGMAIGAGVGGVIAAAAALLIPGVGPVLAGGILATVVGGAAAGAAAGGLLGMFAGMGIPDDEARYYEGEFNEGRTLVTVQAAGRIQEVHDVLHRHGAYDVEHRDRAVRAPIV